MNPSPARMLAIYGGVTFLVYIETSSFVKSSPAILLSLPVIALSLLTLTTTMSPEQRFTTSASFAIHGTPFYSFFSSCSFCFF
ncbi:hypothetical protein OESDEN_23168 [Oesophagostomum dentatum]|uniref:Uncharacterized protein n=1 Tax=Oesophagostomum dentatum TaxID=61180 RepID=A0A0B1S153_OESDE|nr:hypothetical protein OESDEN_23168 [Oesophagostomum dentatum]